MSVNVHKFLFPLLLLFILFLFVYRIRRIRSCGKEQWKRFIFTNRYIPSGLERSVGEQLRKLACFRRKNWVLGVPGEQKFVGIILLLLYHLPWNLFKLSWCPEIKTSQNQLKWLDHVIRAFQTIHSFGELEITNKQKFILFLFGFPLFSNFFRSFQVSERKTWNFVDKIKTSECELVNPASFVLQQRNIHSSLYILIILKLCNNFVERLPNYANNTFKHYIERREGSFGIQINFRKRRKGVDYNRMAMEEKTLYFTNFSSINMSRLYSIEIISSAISRKQQESGEIANFELCFR